MKFCKRNIFGLVSAISVIALCSCASILNTKTTQVNIVTNTKSKVEFEGDTISRYGRSKYLSVFRSGQPLNITVFNDSITKYISVRPKNSFAFWLNAYSILTLPGFVIDMHSPKRFGYPSTVYVDMHTADSTYRTYIPWDESKGRDLFKITPLKLIGLYNPGIEVSYERYTGKGFSSQATFSYLFPVYVWDADPDFEPEIKGFSAAIEEKYYLRKEGPQGPYLGLELDLLKKDYRDISYFIDKAHSNDSIIVSYPDSISISNFTFSTNLKFGHQFFFDGTVLDIYFGLGFKYRSNVHSGRSNPGDEMESPVDFNFDYLTRREGKYWTISIPLNVRIGLTF